MEKFADVPKEAAITTNGDSGITSWVQSLLDKTNEQHLSIQAEKPDPELKLPDLAIDEDSENTNQLTAQVVAQNPEKVEGSDIPDLTISGTASGETDDFFDGAGRVISELAEGAYEELVENPLNVAANVAIGAAIAVGAAFASPVVLAVAAGAAIGATAAIVYEEGGKWVDAISTVANPGSATAAELADAKETVQGLGAGALDLAAGGVGGIGASVAIKSAARAAVVGAETAVERSAAAEAASISDNALGKSPFFDEILAKGTAQEFPGAPRRPQIIEIDDVAIVAAKALTPEESILQSQATFNAKLAEDAVMAARKQAYNVRFEKVTKEGTLVKTLENPEGEVTEVGNFIATRLDDNGMPVIENGMVNQWPIKAKDIPKRYNTTADELATTDSVVLPTRTDGPPVHVVEAPAGTKIETSWGPVKLEKPGYLANYDFDAIAGKPGTDFNLISQRSFDQTYFIDFTPPA